MLALFIIIPLLIALLGVAVLPDSYSKAIALAGSVAGLAMLPFVQSGTYTMPWFSSAGFLFGITTSVGVLNIILLVMILSIAPLVLLYSFGFMDTQSQQRRFYIEMLAFEAAMVLFAVSGNFITMFIAWEFLSLTSYLLIGFWSDHSRANRAARKAITIVFLGDVAILSAIIIIAVAFHSLEFSSVLAAMPLHPQAALAAAVLLAFAALTKSAQFPFQEWLTDAMEGPAPVSAFLHSTTMVKAGVFLIIILLPLFEATGIAAVLSVVSLVTVAIATANALKERHVKKIIAYSTIQELGLMIFAVSSGAVLAGVFLFFAHSFYKALLFFSSGAMMKATGKEDITEISGLRKNNVLYIATLFGVLSIMGFVPFDGFFANSMLGSAFSANLLYYIILNAFGILTSFYMFRWLLFTSKKENSPDTGIMYTALPRSMVLSAMALGVAALLASFVVPYFSAISPALPYSYLASAYSFSVDGIVVIAAAAIGMAAGYIALRKNIAIKSAALNALLYNKWIFNRFYEYSAAFVCGIGDGAEFLEQKISSFYRGIAMSVYDSAGFIRKVSYGSINLYVLTLATAVVIAVVLIYFVT